MKKYYHFFTTVFTYFVFAISIASATVVNIQINTLTFGSEISWDLSDSSGTVLISGSGYGNNNTYDNYINLTDGCYDLNMYDSFGDGWNGGTYNVLDSLTNNIMFTGGITNGSFGSDQICFGPLGCTNPLADNYDSSAIIDNGSCIFSNCNPLTLNLYDSYGDGWNGNDFVMTSSSGVVFFSTTLLNGDTGTAFVCAPDDCYSITCNGGSFQYEISWDLKDSSGGVVMSGGAPFFDSICFPIIYGCTDILANNYDSLANQNDGSCIYPSCLAPAPTLEEFSIGSIPLGYCYPNPSNLWSSSLTFGDGWRFTGNPGYDASSNGRAQGTYAWVDFSGTDVGVVLEMEDIDVSVLDTAHLIFDFFSYSNGSTSPNTMFIEAWDGINWNTIDSLTLDISGWNTYFYDISSQVYNSNTISIRFRCESSGSSTDYYNDLLLDNIKVDNSPIFGCSNILALNYDSTVTIDNGSCLFPSGCTDSLALNYDSSAITNDGSCLYQTGCTNPLADNYDSTAIIDDGSCFFSNCTYLTLNMSDSYGDGWNGNDFSIFDSNGNLVLNSTINNGYSGFENMCLPDDCYSITCNGGSWQNEVSWTLTDTAGLVILSGGAPYSDSICFPIIYGCMNTLADNYDSLANFDNGLCFFGCIDTDTTESFESGQGITWLLDPNNTVDWTNRSGGTPSNSTGPSGAFDGSFYMYTEASFGGDNKDAIMYVPCVDVGAWNQLAFVFAYHMYGSNMGDLTVDISTDSGVTWIEEWTVSGNQGDQWFETIIDLSTYSGSISVRLHAETGNGFRSDIAIDFLRFVEAPVFGCTDNNSLNYNPNATFDNGSCFYGCIDSDTLESFESGQGFTWELDPNNTIDWTNQSGGTPSFNTGPSGAFDGSYYMYTEASSGNSNKEAIMYVSCVDPLGWNQLSFVFAYHMRGTNMGSLTIDISTDSGTTWIQQWTISGNQGNQWNEVQLDLGTYTQNISVRVHAQTGNGYSSDIAIDLLRFEEYPVSGCMDPFASNFDPLATIDDGTCLYTGCTDILAANYCTGCNVTDNSLCIYYLCSGLNFTDNFEGNSLSANGWTTFSGTSASVSLTNVNPIADTVSIEFEGASGGTWSGYQTESDAYANTLHIASISKCIDFTTIGNNDSIALTFETKMY